MALSIICAGQCLFGQKIATLSSPVLFMLFFKRLLHSGHFVGILNSCVFVGRNFLITSTTSGITSPALRKITVSPM